MKAIRPMLAAMMLAAAALAQPVRAEPVVLTLSNPVPAGHPALLRTMQFARRVEERSHGQLKVEVFPAAQLGSQNEVLQKVKLGAIDMAVSSPDYLTKYEKAFAILVMPYLFNSEEHAHRVLDGPAMDWLAPLAEKQGFVILTQLAGGFRNITNSKRPINRPQDLRGLRIRVPPAVEVEDFMEALGAETHKIGNKELYPALSQGVVDGQELTIDAIYYRKLYETQKHLALTRHSYYSAVLLISARSWARLTRAQQDILREESQTIGDATRQSVAAHEEELVARMAAAGVKVTRPDLQPFRDAAGPVRRKIALFAGEANTQRFLKMVDDGRSR